MSRASEEQRQEQRKEFLELYGWLRENKAKAAAYRLLTVKLREALSEEYGDYSALLAQAVEAALETAQARYKDVLEQTPEKP